VNSLNSESNAPKTVEYEKGTRKGKKGWAALGYDKSAHDRMKDREDWINSMVKDYKARMALYGIVIVLAIGLILLKIFI
jgi:hypothetical protein